MSETKRTCDPISKCEKAVFGIPDRQESLRVLLLGSGEIGKEITIELMRLGAWVIAADSYDNAPAMQVAQSRRAFAMSDEKELEKVIEEEKPDIIVPEVEAIATNVLSKAAKNGIDVVPSSRIAQICMNREDLRVLAAEKLGIKTADYRFAQSAQELEEKAKEVGFPCVVKPIMSSSGHGQSIVRSQEEIQAAWNEAQTGRRAADESTISRVIVEALVPLDYELTVLTVSSSAGIVACEPVGHRQEDGDYRESWQPADTGEKIAKEARETAKQIVSGLVQIARDDKERGWGIFGVELFVLTDGSILFNEVSPRPHDTGLVTCASQRYSEFALHARAALGIAVTEEDVCMLSKEKVCASRAVVIEGNGRAQFSNLPCALSVPGSDLRIFSKPEVHGRRRMGVILAQADTEKQVREKTREVLDLLTVDII